MSIPKDILHGVNMLAFRSPSGESVAIIEEGGKRGAISVKYTVARDQSFMNYFVCTSLDLPTLSGKGVTINDAITEFNKELLFVINAYLEHTRKRIFELLAQHAWEPMNRFDLHEPEETAITIFWPSG